MSASLSLAVDKWDYIIAAYALIPSIDGDTSISRVEGVDYPWTTVWTGFSTVAGDWRKLGVIAHLG